MRKIATILLTVLLSLSCFSAFACGRGEEVSYDTTYIITYDLVGGELPTGAITTYIESDSDITLPVPTKADCVFLGWVESGKTELVTVIAAGTKGDKIFTATWRSRVVYNITYDVVGGELPTDAVVNYTLSETNIILPVPTMDGYEFLGWIESGKTEIVQIIPAGSTGDKAFTAVWKSYPFEVIINNTTAAGFTAWADDSTGSKTVYVNVGDKLIIPAIKWDDFNETWKNNEDYEFLGWFYRDKDNAERQFDPNTAFTLENLNLNAYNVTLYAKVRKQWAGPY